MHRACVDRARRHARAVLGAGIEIARRIGDELVLAAGIAEVMRGARVHVRVPGAVDLHGHAADRIDGRSGLSRRPVRVRVVLHGSPHTPPGYLLTRYTPRGYMSSMQQATKTSCRKRLSRIEGQVRGLARMVEEDRYCIDIVTQLSAVRAALARVEEEVLRDHVAHCVENAIASGNAAEQRQKVAELMDVLARSQR